FVAIDISDASLDLARKAAAKFGLKNVEFRKLPIERAAELGRSFDFILCHGVLHHLDDPVVGLRALGSVLRDDGVVSAMLYGRYGRTGIYMLQELFRDRLGLSVNHANLERLQAVFTMLPEEHPFRIVHKNRGERLALEELADMILHPRDKAYAVAD